MKSCIVGGLLLTLQITTIHIAGHLPEAWVDSTGISADFFWKQNMMRTQNLSLNHFTVFLLSAFYLLSPTLNHFFISDVWFDCSQWLTTFHLRSLCTLHGSWHRDVCFWVQSGLDWIYSIFSLDQIGEPKCSEIWSDQKKSRICPSCCQSDPLLA